MQSRSALKRPAAAVEEDGDCGDDDEADDGSDGDEEPRDRNKAHHFFKHFDNLPDHVKQFFTNPPSDKRKFQTSMINKLIMKKDNGRYDINLKAPLFTDHSPSIYIYIYICICTCLYGDRDR
jgi:hypothetical protein